MNRVWFATILLGLAGCGGGGVSVGTIGLQDGDDVVASVEPLAAAVEGSFQLLQQDEASNSAIDDILDDSGSSLGGLEKTSPAGLAAGLALQPLADPLRASLDERPELIDTFPEGRRSRVVMRRLYDQGPIIETETDVWLTYSSTPTATGDLNHTAPVADGGPHAYVHAAVTAVSTLRAGGRLVQRGYRQWHSSPDNPWLTFVLSEQAENARLPVVAAFSRGAFAVTAPDQGDFFRAVTFADGRNSEKRWQITERAGGLDLVYAKTTPRGARETGTITYRPGDDRRCRLDDALDATLVRDFPVADDAQGVTVPVQETRTITTGSLDGRPQQQTRVEVLWSDGQRTVQQQTTTLLSPTTCGETDSELRLQTQIILSDRNQVTYTWVRRPGRVAFEAEQPTDDGTLTVSGVRTQEFTAMRAERRDTDGELVSQLALEGLVDGEASGTLFHRFPDGTTATAAVARSELGTLAFSGVSVAGLRLRPISRRDF